jgi:hypothetical protein
MVCYCKNYFEQLLLSYNFFKMDFIKVNSPLINPKRLIISKIRNPVLDLKVLTLCALTLCVLAVKNKLPEYCKVVLTFYTFEVTHTTISQKTFF